MASSTERITVTVSPDQVESANAFLATLDPAMDGTFSETLLTVSAVLPLALVEQIAAHFPGALRGEAGRLAALE